jgi:hypothetical protein
MQMPIMAKAVFMGGFIASGGFAVKAESGGPPEALLHEILTAHVSGIG